MSQKLLLLPAKDFARSRLLRVPDDFSERDAVRHVTALIAQVQEEYTDWTWEQLAPVLEDHGFTAVSFILGPELD